MGIVIQADDGMYFFYSETWADLYGPYSTEFLAHLNMSRYIKKLG